MIRVAQLVAALVVVVGLAGCTSAAGSIEDVRTAFPGQTDEQLRELGLSVCWMLENADGNVAEVVALMVSEVEADRGQAEALVAWAAAEVCVD